jgi:hypothetical protein
MPIIYTVPKSLVMRNQLCDYCDKVSERCVTTYDRLHGIKCCEEHIPLGKRDVNAYLREEGLVRQKDFLEMYPRLTEMKLNVPRTDGSITPDGNLSQEPFQVLTKDEGDWRIRVLFKDPTTKEILNKMMKVRDLDKSGVSEEEIARWIKSLDEFYIHDYTVHKAAVEFGEKVTELDAPMIGKVYIQSGSEVRFIKPSQP